MHCGPVRVEVRAKVWQVSWKKRLTDGRMKNIAFVLDPDGYWIEVWQSRKFACLDR